MKYANVSEVEAGFRLLDAEKKSRCEAMLEEAALVIDAYNSLAPVEHKTLVACRMVRRQLGDAGSAVGMYPIGASQGSASAPPQTP